MVWFVQPLERKTDEGEPSGLWHLCAQSDEGGGFYAGCNHDHVSAEEAQTCKEALIHIGQVTGFPHKEEAEEAEKPVGYAWEQAAGHRYGADGQPEWYGPWTAQIGWNVPEYGARNVRALYPKDEA